jgi:hypothetical protein
MLLPALRALLARPTVGPGRLPAVVVRLAAYAVAVAALGVWVGFTRLGAGGLWGDEASFAFTTDHMLETGDWVVPRIHDAGPHLNAAPLYNWLTCLTAGWFGDGNLKYRAWAAGFGVGCGLAVLALGAVLFRPAVGLVAAVVLLSNHHLLFVHGVRHGVMETGTMFFVTLGAVCYARACRSAGRGLGWWAGAGLCLGAGTLMKPPAIPGFFFLVTCAHHLLTRRDLPVRARLAGPLLALAAAAVAVPWYAALYDRLGQPALEHLFVHNSVGRAAADMTATGPQPMFYLDWARDSSAAFRFALPALAVAAAVAAAGRGPGWGLPALLAGSFLAAISAAATKLHHYSYYAFPFLAVLVAAVLLAGLGPPPAPGRRVRAAWRVLAVAGAAAAAAAAVGDCRSAVRHVGKHPYREYPPLVFHDALRGELEAGRVRLVVYRQPPANPALGLGEAELYHLRFRMPQATPVTTHAELNGLLADGRPAVVCPSPGTDHARLAAAGLLPVPDRVVAVRTEPAEYHVLLFHGAEAACDLGGLIRSVTVDRHGRPLPAPR